MTIPSSSAQTIDAAIHANLAALAARLDIAEMFAVQARAAMGGKRRNEAVGTLMPLEHIIPECEALVRTILLLHRAPFVDGAGL